MTKRNPFAKDLPEMAQGLREGGSKTTAGEKGTELRPCDSYARSDPARFNTYHAAICDHEDWVKFSTRCRIAEAVMALADAENAALTAALEDRDSQLNEATNVPDDGPFIWIARGRQGGEPCIGGTRIPVGTLTGYADALGDDAALASYPSTTAADLEEARWFMGHPHDDPRPDRCQGCDDEHCTAKP